MILGRREVEARALHAATSWEGGAGIAASRIVAAEVRAGVDAELIFRAQSAHESPIAGQVLPIKGRDRLLSRSVTGLNRAVTRQPSVLFTPMQANTSTQALINRASGRILHLHNSYNMTSIADLRAKGFAGPVVVTLHDERALTAGCHATLGCDGPLRACRLCPQSRASWLWPTRSSFRAHASQLHDSRVFFTAPSRWMANQAGRFGVPAERLHHIPNPIDVDLFQSHKRSSWPNAHHTLTLAWLPGKDESTFWAALSLLEASLARNFPQVTLRVLTTDDAQVPNHFLNVRVPRPTTDPERAAFWAAGDIAVSITRADNFPNVVLEAIATGTPICISDVGGAAEAVAETGGGYVINGQEPEDVATVLLQALTRRNEWSAQMEHAVRKLRLKYSYEVIGAAFASLYSDVEGRFPSREPTK